MSLRWWLQGTTSWLSIRTSWLSLSSRITTVFPQSPSLNQRTLIMSSPSSQTVCTYRTQMSPLKDSGYMERHGKTTNSFLDLHPKFIISFGVIMMMKAESHLCVAILSIPEVKVCCPPLSVSGCLPTPLPAVTLHSAVRSLHRGVSYMQGVIPSLYIPLWARDLCLLPGLTLHLCFDMGLSDTCVTRNNTIGSIGSQV